MIGFRLCSAGGTFSFIFAVLGVACAHIAMNLTDDYFDYKVDMLGDRDKVIRHGFRAMLVKYPYLTDGSETLKSTARAIAAFTLVALCCCGVILADRQETPVFAPMGLWWIGVIVLCCAFFGVFYSAPPVKLAYRGLGEPVIGIIFGCFRRDFGSERRIVLKHNALRTAVDEIGNQDIAPIGGYIVTSKSNRGIIFCRSRL